MGTHMAEYNIEYYVWLRLNDGSPKQHTYMAYYIRRTDLTGPDQFISCFHIPEGKSSTHRHRHSPLIALSNEREDDLNYSWYLNFRITQVLSRFY